jgi:Holliday junction resolvase
METNEKKENGDKAEELFVQYLNDNKIPFYRINQEVKSYSKQLSDNDIRRPDLIIHLKKGLFYVDVKYRTKINFGENDEKRFYLNIFEIKGLTNFQNELNSNVWISFTDNLEKPDFHYISLSSVNEYFECLKNAVGIDFYNLLETNNQEAKKYYGNLFYCFPESLLYHGLSIEKGFFTEYVDQNYFNKEAEYHKIIWRKPEK